MNSYRGPALSIELRSAAALSTWHILRSLFLTISFVTASTTPVLHAPR